jgi:hypothetical protein
MNISSRKDDPYPIIPACLSDPGQYDPTIDLLYEDDPEATEKRAVVKREEVSRD